MLGKSHNFIIFVLTKFCFSEFVWNYPCMLQFNMNPKPKVSLIVFAITLVLSLFVIIPMSLNLNNFKGNCLLYSKGSLSNGSKNATFKWGSSSNCNFVLYIGYLALVTSTVLIWQSAIYVWKEYDRSPFGAFIVFCGNGVVALGILIAALISTVGYSAWCDSFINDTSMCQNVDLSILDNKFKIVSKYFYGHMMVAQFGIWSSLIVWLFALVVSFLKVRHFHESDDLLQSLAYEKEKLFNRRGNYSRVHFETSDTAQVL